MSLKDQDLTQSPARIKMLATCPEQTKACLVQELKSLGVEDLEENYMAVRFSVDEEMYYRCHLKNATASHLLRIISEFKVSSDADVFTGALEIPFESYFAANKTIKIQAVVGDQKGYYAPSANRLSQQLRLAIQERFSRLGLEKPKVDLEDPAVTLHILLRNKSVCISICTSGKALHKRGYRMDGHPAPLKETLAASLLHLVGYDGTQAFLDPMCGSGTIAIEAAYIALHKAPQIHRKKGDFGFEQLKDFNNSLYRVVQDQERATKLEAPLAPLFASDIEAKFVKIAQESALKARVEKYIHFAESSFWDLNAPCAEGILVSNLPFGERISQKEEWIEYYKRVGDHLKKNFQGWRAGLLVHKDSPYKHIGLKTSAKYDILNGSLETKFCVFDLYQGSKKGLSRS